MSLNMCTVLDSTYPEAIFLPQLTRLVNPLLHLLLKGRLFQNHQVLLSETRDPLAPLNVSNLETLSTAVTQRNPTQTVGYTMPSDSSFDEEISFSFSTDSRNADESFDSGLNEWLKLQGTLTQSPVGPFDPKSPISPASSQFTAFKQSASALFPSKDSLFQPINETSTKDRTFSSFAASYDPNLAICTSPVFRIEVLLFSKV